MMTVGGWVAAFWFALAIAPVGFCVPAYEPPLSDLMVTAPLLLREPSWCAQDALPAMAAGAPAASEIDATSVAIRAPALRPD